MNAIFKYRRSFTFTATLFVLCVLCAGFLSCKVSYGFNEKTSSIPDSIKTVRINLIENRAPYQNPQLSPSLTEQLKRKVTNQTKLTLVNANNANPDWEISGEIRDYSVSTTGVTSANGQSQSSINRLT